MNKNMDYGEFVEKNTTYCQSCGISYQKNKNSCPCCNQPNEEYTPICECGCFEFSSVSNRGVTFGWACGKCGKIYPKSFVKLNNIKEDFQCNN